MSTAQKDTIYIDIDDEITSIIEKVQSSPEKIVALVLPKRAAMLQSIVNMKLLKRSGEESGKKIVLITSEASILPLAGSVGLYAARTLQSRPEIPAAPSMGESAIDEIAEEAESPSEEDSPEVDASKSVGELSGAKSANKVAASSKKVINEDDPIEVDSPEEEAAVADATKPAKEKKDKKLKVPNFNKFRLKLALGLLALIVLIGGWYVAAFVMPQATITVETNTTTVASEFSFIARPGLDELDEERSIVPGIREELRQTDTERAEATGQRDIGERASGEVTLTLTDCSRPQVTIPAGTGVTSGNLTYITQENVRLGSVQFAGECRNEDFPEFSSQTVDVTAQNAGEQYNVRERSYDVNGFNNVNGEGSRMRGGTSEVVTVVRQEDVDGARQRVVERNEDIARQELANQLRAAGYIPLTTTLNAGNPEVASSPNVDDEADEVTITATVVYTMVGVSREDLLTLVISNVEDDIDTERQSILDDGLDDATFRIISRESNGDVRLSVQTFVVAGPELNEDAIKDEVKGVSRSETEQIIRSRPGIQDVTIDYSPFWVYSTPRNADKITIIIESNNEVVEQDEPDSDEEDEVEVDEP
jgi:hypothetical protein